MSRSLRSNSSKRSADSQTPTNSDDAANTAPSLVDAAASEDGVRKKARHESSTVSAVSAAAGAPSPPAVSRLYGDVLGRILVYLPLQDQIAFSGVRRQWNAAARVSRRYIAWRSMTALPLADWNTTLALFNKQDLARQANARIHSIVKKQRNQLREAKCAAVSGPLLSLLRSLVVVGVPRADAEAGVARVELPVPPPCASAVTAQSTCTLHVSWQTIESVHRGIASKSNGRIHRSTWKTHVGDTFRIRYQSTGGEDSDETELMLCNNVVRDRSKSDCEAQKLVAWLRCHSILAGSLRQQSCLLSTFVQTVLEAAGNRTAESIHRELFHDACGYLAEEEAEEEENDQEEDSSEEE